MTVDVVVTLLMLLLRVRVLAPSLLFWLSSIPGIVPGDNIQRTYQRRDGTGGIGTAIGG